MRDRTTPDALIPIACVPEAIPAAEREGHFRLVRQLFGTRARETRPLPDGYAVRFDADALDDVARWVANERRCCPFLTFTIEIAPGGGAVEVRLTGPAGTRELLRAQMRGE